MKVITHMMDALGGDEGPDFDRIALAMVDATKAGTDEAVSKNCCRCLVLLRVI